MNCIDLNSKWSKMLLRRKTFESTQNYKSDQIGIQNEQKLMSYVANHSKPLNNKSDQNTMTFTDLISKTSKQRKTTKIIKLLELHRFDVQTIKTTQNYKSDQNTMNCIDMMSKVIKLRWICTDLTSKRSKMLR